MANQQQAAPQEGYDHEEAFESSMLPVDDIHSIHYEQYGLRNGLPGKFEEASHQGSIPVLLYFEHQEMIVAHLAY